MEERTKGEAGRTKRTGSEGLDPRTLRKGGKPEDPYKRGKRTLTVRSEKLTPYKKGRVVVQEATCHGVDVGRRGQQI